jgi:hypothetical protein
MRLLHANASKESVSFFTRYVFAIWALKYLFDPFEQLARLPYDYASPVGILRLIPDVTMHTVVSSMPGMFLIRLVTICSCIACVIRPTIPIFSALASVLIVAEQSLLRSFGHVNHAEIPLVLAAITLSAFALANASRLTPSPAPGKPDNRYAGPLVTVALLICMTYSLVGITRLTTGGYHIFVSDMLLKVTFDHAYLPWLLDFDLGQHIDEWPLAIYFLKVGFPIVTLLEVLAPMCLISRRFSVLFVCVMVSFHLVVLILMKLPFFENILLMAFLVEAPWFHSTVGHLATVGLETGTF